MRTLVLLALAVGGSAGPGRPAPSIDQARVEAPASIEELARVYRSGLYERAVAVAALWSDRRIALETRRLIAQDAEREKAGAREVTVLPTLDVVSLERHPSAKMTEKSEKEEREATRLAAAATLAESALVRLRGGDRRLLAPGLSTASLLLESGPLGARGRSFAQRFFLLAGLLLHCHVEIAAGHGLLAMAIQRFPADPELHTALGSTIETVASLRTYDLPPWAPEVATLNSGGYTAETGAYGGVLPGATLAEAEAQYEQALVSDPGFDEARLRLARVHLLMGRAEDALRDLERVVTQAGQGRQRYLARLFTGYGRQRQGDLDGAVAAYRACVAHGPRTQTALIALGRSLGQLGDEQGAQEAFAGASAPGAPLDPWSTYGAGQPERFDELVARLRELVK